MTAALLTGCWPARAKDGSMESGGHPLPASTRDGLQIPTRPTCGCGIRAAAIRWRIDGNRVDPQVDSHQRDGNPFVDNYAFVHDSVKAIDHAVEWERIPCRDGASRPHRKTSARP